MKLTKGRSEDVSGIMQAMGLRARKAAGVLAQATSDRKNRALEAAAAQIIATQDAILAANAKDIEAGRAGGMTDALVDRLTLDPGRIDAIARSLADIAALVDPVGRIVSSVRRPNGLVIDRILTPLGVIGVIFESRPNVTADAGALCLKSGNASILRCGSDSYHSSHAIHTALCKGLEKAGLPVDAIQLVPTTDRAAVGELLKGLSGAVDVIVPRGGKSLVARVQSEARVPVFSHLEGICHIYVDKSADPAMATEVVTNAKMRRTSICGAAETLLIHQDIATSAVPEICHALAQKGCEIRGDAHVQKLFANASAATEQDWTSEYLDAIISVRIVASAAAAIEHIQTYSSGHTEAILAEDPDVVAAFFAEIDSAILMHNASTQFADGGEFGMGAEIGIATGKLHARGPVGVEQLTSFKYLVKGTGQIRP